VNQGTGESHLTEVQNMPPQGDIVYCSGKVPPQATGVIIAALMMGPGNNHRNALFVCSDENGSFQEPRNGQPVNGIFNYTGTWIGGIIFAPFLKDTKQFKFLLGSDVGTPDTRVNCRGAVIGWF
jgi:hypothetical protein